jgi:hypothetical protein
VKKSCTFFLSNK